jgi:hypothetical protein
MNYHKKLGLKALVPAGTILDSKKGIIKMDGDEYTADEKDLNKMLYENLVEKYDYLDTK